MKKLFVGDYETLIDDDIYEVTLNMKLRTIMDKRSVRYVMYQDGKSWKNLSRFIMDAPKEKMVDHINHNTLDNQRSNLRLCTNQQNQANSLKQRKIGHSKYKGVTYVGYRPNLSKKWQSGIYVNGKSIYIGNYETESEAAIAYNNSAIIHFGEYAHLNEVPK